MREHPLRERLQAQLMLALYRSGRQAEALDTYRRVQRSLEQELGLEPGRALKELERAILAHDPALDPRSRGAQPLAIKPGRRGRRGGLLIAEGEGGSWEATADTVIGADGANGIVARSVGLRRERSLAIAIEAEVPHVWGTGHEDL